MLVLYRSNLLWKVSSNVWLFIIQYGAWINMRQTSSKASPCRIFSFQLYSSPTMFHLLMSLGQLCTLSTPHGPQVGDLNIFSLHNHRERFWAARTRQLHASHVTTGDRLWSNLPFLRPLCTIVADSLGGKRYGKNGADEVGGRCHDLLGTRCDPYGTSPRSADTEFARD